MVLLNDFTHRPGGDDPGGPGVRAELLSLMIDGIAEQYELLAVVQARLAALLCEGLRFAEENQDLFTDTDSDTADPVKVQEWVRRAFTAELSTALHLSERKVDSLLGSSETLVTELPGTLAALREGQITVQHAENMIAQATGLAPAEKTQFEQAALPAAKTTTPPQFTRTATRIRENLNPETITERRRAAETDRRGGDLERPRRNGLARDLRTRHRDPEHLHRRPKHSKIAQVSR